MRMAMTRMAMIRKIILMTKQMIMMIMLVLATSVLPIGWNPLNSGCE